MQTQAVVTRDYLLATTLKSIQTGHLSASVVLKMYPLVMKIYHLQVTTGLV